MNYEEKIQELSERIAKLEKSENKRIAKRKRDITFKIIKLVILVILLFMGYIYLIKPYKEKIDNVNQKVNTVESFVNEKWEALQKYNPFTK